MENICRICMTVSDELISMVKEIKLNNYEILATGEMFEECFGLKLEDIPTFRKICIQCKIQLTYFHDFKVQALKTHEKLLKIHLEDDPGTEETCTKEDEGDRDVYIVEYLEDEQESVIPHIDSHVSVAEEANENEEKFSPSMEHVSELEDNDIQCEDGEFDETKFLEYLESQNWRRKPRKRPKRMHSETIFKFKCEPCGRKFRNESTFNAHQNVHNGLPAYNCTICNKGFNHKVNFEYHMKNHNNNRNYKCVTCDKSFICNWDLKLHLRCHADIRPFVCDICGKQFRVRSHMTDHLETHNEGNQNECPICHQMYKTKATLKMHIESIHIRSKQYFCPICDKSFYRRHHMKVHYQIHQKRKS